MKRRNKLLLSIAALLCLMLVVLWFGWIWLLRSDGGRDFALEKLQSMLPQHALQWQSAQGILGDTLVLNHVVFAMAGHRIEAKTLTLQARWSPWQHRQIIFNAVKIENARWQRAAPDDQPSTRSWREQLPTLDLPVALQFNDIQISDLSIVDHQQQTPINIQRASGRMQLQSGLLVLDEIKIDSDEYALTLTGKYAPANKFHTKLNGSITLNKMVDRPILTINASGNIDVFTVAIDGKLPGKTATNLRIVPDGERLQWQFDSTSDALVLDRFGIKDTASHALNLQLSGIDQQANVRGWVSRDDLRITIDPSQVSLAEQTLTLSPLVIGLLDGKALIEGRVSIASDAPILDVKINAEQLRWGEGSSQILADIDTALTGKIDNWQLDGSSVLTRDKQQARIVLKGSGNQKTADITSLQITTPTAKQIGRLDGSAQIGWDKSINIDAQLELAQFDLGYFLPEWRGQISGPISLDLVAQHDRRDQLNWQGSIDAPSLSGQLRNRSLNASLNYSGTIDNGKLDTDIALGESRIDATGTIGKKLDIAIAMQPLNLTDLIPAASGIVVGNINVQGALDQPQLRSDLRASDLIIEGQKIAVATLRGTLGMDDSPLLLNLQSATLAGLDIDTIDGKIAGSAQAADITLQLKGPLAKIDLSTRLARNGSAIDGTLNQLDFLPERGPAAKLQSPSSFVWRDDRLQVEATCLIAEPSQLCIDGDSADVLNIRGQRGALAWFDPLLNIDSAVRLSADGSFDLDAQLRQTAGRWRGQAVLRSSAAKLIADTAPDRPLFGWNTLQINLTLDNSQWNADIDADLLDDGQLRGRLASADGLLDGEFDLALRDLIWLELLSEDLVAPRGRIDGKISISGTLQQPKLAGALAARELHAELPTLGLKLSDGRADLAAQPDGSAVLSGSINSGDGLLNIDGQLRWDTQTAPLQFAIHGQSVLVSDTPNLQARISPALTLRIEQGAAVLRGRINVPQANVDLEALDAGVSTSDDVVIIDPREGQQRRQAFSLDADLALGLGDDVKLRGFGLNGELEGELRVRDHPQREPIARGTLNASGNYRAYGQQLKIEKGRLIYTNAPLDNPALDLLATRDRGDVKVGLRIRGDARTPETSAWSDPAMPQADALAWLVLGRPLNTATAIEAKQVGAAADSLGASSLLAQSLGLRLGLDDVGIVQSRALGGSTFRIGKYLSPRLYLGYGVSLIGEGQVMLLRYQLRRKLEVELESGLEERASLNWKYER